MPGNSEASLVVRLARTRGAGQMPPIASPLVDDAGVATVEAWIRTPSR